MHDSKIMPDTGVMLNVNGSNIATPFAPPKPGNTPINIPSTMPKNISAIFTGDRATAKP